MRGSSGERRSAKEGDGLGVLRTRERWGLTTGMAFIGSPGPHGLC